jgi:hypothetical protein
MPNTLIFPEGIRLAARDEIPGPEPHRSELWARVQSASIEPGFLLKPSQDPRFACYAEINVDAPSIWNVFRDLCLALLEPAATLLAGDIDSGPQALGTAPVAAIIATLDRHKDRLAHDGYLQFGLLSIHDDRLNEVFVVPTKHFQVWLNDLSRFRAVMSRHAIREAAVLQFIDEYPRTTVRLAWTGDELAEPSDFISHLEREIAATAGG